ncbi:MAG: dTMP kinase [Firmicutes bacterium]|nr:dTMP kinase [Bacillota bacterium]
MLHNKLKSGLFLSIEGPDGAGKTTQAQLLKDRLQKLGCKVVLTREPGGTPIGEKIREILLNPDFREMTVFCEVLLYSAARTQLVDQYILPYLEKGFIVISDRYLDSSIVYQGLAGGEKPEIVETINLWATRKLLPAATFVLDIDAESGLFRLQKEKKDAQGRWGDRMEQKELEFHRKVRQGFLQLAAQSPDRFFVIRAEDRPETVHEKIWNKMQKFL